MEAASSGDLSAHCDPFALFDEWYAKARQTELNDSNAVALASDQSAPLDCRETFLARYDAVAAQHDGEQLVRPEHWGGYLLTPRAMEFWVDRQHRLHERRRYTFAEGGWTSTLLYP